ncbi:MULTISPECIES: Ldh family oxidoreductase [unclassified Enterococcus]|uniref:Ldh family oxidoreductase n=1 Tax=unclassified Enterococcus TaxID=2608891 RepID=UPI0015533C34|nr:MULTISPECIES: Ldh family oxidoreductase [unclassified Enterococcus]MBS7578415.1 Ldh family oxidoreductase [Enterococcus sp. MMGLQ5-2]MBS7585646.1 Ldh family oxidoreductase [Enterococcus sp. MMGLQ5-1]NPD13505.1 Ldh family oxidoreductase [Enterococcus sp. MMGLQ5-1]NPD38247.1 Ldh family oxidoreductase [Enterococcus sp. MMGLQ5-2]
MKRTIYYESANVLYDFIYRSFLAVGLQPEEAKIASEVLMFADLRGIDSHGIGRLKQFYIDRIAEGLIQVNSSISIVKESLSGAVIDGHNGLGLIIANKAMKLAIEKAKKTGIAVIFVRNSSHYGAAGYGPFLAAKEGLIGISGTNASRLVASINGTQPILGTNPIAVSFPSDEPFPFLFDGATSTISVGKIEYYQKVGKMLPNGWVRDEKGNAVNNPAQALAGIKHKVYTLAPLGGFSELEAGFKGFGLGLIVELMSTIVQSGSKFCGDYQQTDQKSVGHFFIAINPELFIEQSEFRKSVGDTLRLLRDCKKEGEKIIVAGEKEYLENQSRKKTGIPIPESVVQDLYLIREQYQISVSFAWE